MRVRRRVAQFVLPGLCLALVASYAYAGAPSPGSRQDDLPNVCKSGPEKGTACNPSDPEPCGVDSNGDPFECVVDLDRFVLKGTVTLIADESPADNDGSSGGGPTITAMLEIQRAENRYFVAKTFQAPNPLDWPQIGGWRGKANIVEEDDIETVLTSFLWQTPSDDIAVCEPNPPGTCTNVLGELGKALNEIASSEFAMDFSGATPVLVSLKQVKKDAGAFDGGDLTTADTAEVVRARFEIRFVGVS